MKISKLFHWLYASVMLMPIFAIGFKCLYVTFNPNAKDSYYGESINESNEVVQTSLITNNEYYFLFNNTPSLSEEYPRPKFYCSSISLINTNAVFDNTQINSLQSASYFSVWYDANYGNNYFTWENAGITLSGGQYNITIKFTYLYSTNTNTATSQFFGNSLWSIEYNDYSYIDNVFYYSVEQIANHSLFSWSNNTFLSSPLLYITNLFGVPSTSPIITLLCFWFSISIIWLVFDMLMYVPLLIHRWLDKGVLE